jgi:arylsulfatase A-like enzyme
MTNKLRMPDYCVGGLRVPLFLKWPKKIEPQTTSDAVVAHVDLFATAVGAASA